MEQQQEQLLVEWYHDFLKGISKEDLVKALQNKEVSQADLTQGGAPNAPQDVIQKEMLKGLKQDDEKISADGNVIAMDKYKIYKAMGLMKALERILTMLDDNINPYIDNPLEKKDLAEKAKKISNSINEVIAEL